VNEIALSVPARLSWEAWTNRMRGLVVLRRKLPFYVGDLLNYGIDNFGEKCWQVISELEYAPETLGNYQRVAKKITEDERADVPFTVYQDIYTLPKRERDKLVTAFQAGTMKRSDIRAVAGATNGNGASAPKDGSAGVPDALEGLGWRVAAVAKALRAGDRDELKARMDELIAEWLKMERR
jgi:hypothetical protein